MLATLTRETPDCAANASLMPSMPTASKIGSSRLNAPPSGVRVVWTFARFDAMVFMRTRWAPSPEAATSSALKTPIMIRSSLSVVGRERELPELGRDDGRDGVVAKLVGGELRRFPVNGDVVAVVTDA